MIISIIIPVFNDAEKLSRALGRLQLFRHAGHEIIVVDGGSTDNSLSVAQQAADIILMSKSGRAIQMNNGAAEAKGDVLLFLHADTDLPDDALSLLSEMGAEKSFWGRFDVRLSGQQTVFRVIEWLMNLRSRVTSMATGDQAIFIERVLFDKIGGYPEIALMEDIAISQALKKQSPPRCLNSKVISSSRRWETNGIVATILLMWKLRLYYFLGMSPDKLHQLYR